MKCSVDIVNVVGDRIRKKIEPFVSNVSEAKWEEMCRCDVIVPFVSDIADEPVQEFISKIKSSARKIHIENDIICYAILNGLKAEIRCVVLRNATSINLSIKALNIGHLWQK